MEVQDFINGKIMYDMEGQYFFIQTPNKHLQMLAELRGWGAIQNMFKLTGGRIDLDAAGKFQDQIGEFIKEAINEKIERLNK